jgi:hypothetical protein
VCRSSSPVIGIGTGVPSCSIDALTFPRRAAKRPRRVVAALPGSPTEVAMAEKEATAEFFWAYLQPLREAWF